jgi:hypothetical protein
MIFYFINQWFKVTVFFLHWIGFGDIFSVDTQKKAIGSWLLAIGKKKAVGSWLFISFFFPYPEKMEYIRS